MPATQAVKTHPFGHSLRQTKTLLEMIKWEHTVFMLPFALMAATVAAHGHGALLFHKLGWIVLAMFGARSAAMAFNRIADARYDALNPRTATRAIPAGTVSTNAAWVFTIVCAGLLVFAAYQLNSLAFALSPVALLLTLGYSYTKRFTPFSHVFLGLALSAAPVGAWIAVTGTVQSPALWLAGAVVCWLTGFDILYALQDVDFDKANGLRSIPAWVGNKRALVISRAAHAVMIALLAMAGVSAHLGPIYFVAVALVTVGIVYEQSLVKHDDLTKLNLAFFTLNGWISVGLFLLTALDVLVRK